MKHTPAPWENRKGVIFVPNTYKSIATVHVQKNFDSEKWKSVEDTEAIANAKLIAAAPELLEALQSLSEWNEKYPPNKVYSYDRAKVIESALTEIVEKGKAAIKKATE